MDKRTIHFTVEGQEIDCFCPEPMPRGDTQQYLCAKFTVDAAWENLQLLAVFRRKGRGFRPFTVPLDETLCCAFPAELLRAPDGGGSVYVLVGLLGLDPGGSAYRLTTGYTAVLITPSCYVRGETPAPPAADIYAELLAAYGSRLDAVWPVSEAGKVLAVGADGVVEPTEMVSGGGEGNVPMMTETTAGIAKVGNNLKIDGEGRLSVDTADTVEGDNTRPITAAAVYATVGNIELLLGMI